MNIFLELNNLNKMSTLFYDTDYDVWLNLYVAFTSVAMIYQIVTTCTLIGYKDTALYHSFKKENFCFVHCIHVNSKISSTR